VVIVSLDTTRADHLGSYGHSVDSSPNLDRFAQSATLFERAFAQSPYTPVSHASILTGLQPYGHGLRLLHGAASNRLDDSVTTLAEVLSARGYPTAGFVSAFTAAPHFGLDQGFPAGRRPEADLT
jgi:arylsulfatase A-like enzyme